MNPHDKLPGAFETNESSLAALDLESINHRFIIKDVFGVVKYLKYAMIDELEDRTNDDLKRHIVAVWHDESYQSFLYRKSGQGSH